jgi:hypothetical protein
MSGTMPIWIERWFGLDKAASEGATWSIDYQWPWPSWITLLAIILAIAFVVRIYLRECRGAGRRYRLMLAAVRLALIGMVLLMIAQVAISLRRTGLPYAALLIDDSQSMTVADRYDDKTLKSLGDRIKISADKDAGITRWNLAKTLLSEQNAALLKRLADGYKLHVYYLTGPRLSRRTEPAGVIEEIKSITPAGDTSRIGAAVRDILDDLRGATPAAIVIASDGVNTDGPTLADAAANAQRRGVPLFCIGLGNNQPVRDLVLSDLTVEDAAFVDDVLNFECKLNAVGFQGSKVSIVLREKDKSDVLAKTEVNIGQDEQSQSVRLTYRPTQVGQFEYVVEAEPLQGELQTDNRGGQTFLSGAHNRQSRVVQVRKEKVRVLLAQASPGYEFRYLRNMLQRDDTIELNTVLQDADMQHAEQDKAALRVFPERREELFAYDVIILGDLNPALLSNSAMQSLAAFVDQPGKGGALVLIAGPLYMPLAYRDTPLARLLPINLSSVRLPDPNESITEGFVLKPTELGLAGPPMQLGDSPEQTERIWQNLPELYWFAETPDLKPGARVLAEHPTRTTREGRPLPIFIMQYVGAGKVLFHATDETWRWRYRVGDLYFARYWIQTIRYLSRSKLSEGGRNVTLTTDRRQYAQGEPVRLRVRFADERIAPAEDDGVTVAVEQAGQQTQRLQLRRTAMGRGTFEGLLNRPSPGGYHAWLATPSVEGRAPAIDFIVAPPPGEFAQVRMDEAALRAAAKISGGRYYTLLTAAKLLDDLPPGRQVPVETLPPIPLWNKWPVLLLFLTLLISEWLLRKRGGMI